MIPPRRRLLADLALLTITFIWGSTFVIVKRALDDSSTLLFLALRFSLASAVLALLFRRWIRVRGVPLPIRPGLLAGGFLFLGYAFQTFGLRLTTPSKCGFITALYIVLVPILSAALYRAWPSWSAWLGVAVAVGGLYLLAAPAGFEQLNRGDLLTMIGAIAWGFHIVVLGHYSRQTDAHALSLVQVATGALLAVASFWWAEPVFVRWTAPLFGALLLTALLATALAFFLQTWAQQFASPTHAALVFSLEPVFAWLTSYVVLGETLGVRGAAGAALILAGILLSELSGR